MCVKSHRHLCLQTFLIIILVVCLLLFSAFAVLDLGIYFLTASSTTVQNDSTQVSVPSTSSQQDDRQIIDPSTNVSIGVPARLVDDKVDIEDDDESTADYLVRQILSWKDECPLFNATIQSGQVLQICEGTDPYSSDRELVQCFRTTLFYSGLASLLPAFLVFLSLIAVCRLLLCPILTLALIYILLAIALLVGAILYNSGVIVANIEDNYPVLFITTLALIILYTILSLFHLLLFALVTCEQRRLRKNGDSEKIMKQSTDDEDDIDDPNAPLYKNGFSPQKKTDFEEQIKDFKYIDDDMSYIFRKG